MHPLFPPDIDSEDVFDKVAAAKHQPNRRRLVASKKLVLTAYKIYEANTPSVGSLVPATLTKVRRQALLHAYDVKTIPLTNLRDTLNKPMMAARCPFCGISEAGTLDHYLPKELYPEFSIFALNLVPSCGPCNTRKRTLILDKNTDVRLFLHPYYDNIPEQTFLTVNVDIRDDVLILKFRVHHPPGMSKAQYDHLCAHFEKLELADRYRKLSLVELPGRHAAFLEHYQIHGGAAGVAANLRTEANTYQKAHGPNFWRVVLYRALAAHNEFCDGGFNVVKLVQRNGAN